MSSSRLIKKYKYIDKEHLVFKDPGRLIKAGNYPALDLDQFDPAANIKSKADITIQAKLSAKNDIPISDAAPAPQTVVSPPENTAENQTSSPVQEVPVPVSRVEIDQAYNNGYQEGRASGLAEGDARAKQVTRIIDNVLAEFDRSSAKFFEEIEKVAIDMSLHLAEKIIGEAASTVPDVIKINVDKCINLLAGAGTVEIKINPSDYEIIKAYLPRLDRKFENRYSFVLEPDQGIQRGGCLVEFEGSMIDGRIETQFEKIKQHMEILT